MSAVMERSKNKAQAMKDVLRNTLVVTKLLDMVKGPLMIEVAKNDRKLSIRAFSPLPFEHHEQYSHAVDTDRQYYTISYVGIDQIDVLPHAVPSPIQPSGLYGPIFTATHSLTDEEIEYLEE